MSDNEPKSWAEILQRRSGERHDPPPREFYVRNPIRHYDDAGIFPDSSTLPFDPPPKCDTHLYSSTAIFDPPEAKGPRRIPPKHDHGLELVAWPKPVRKDQSAEAPKHLTFRDRKVRDFDMITGVPFESPFKATLAKVYAKREQSQQFSQTKRMSPVSHHLPTEALDEAEVREQAQARQNFVDFHLSRIPPNERRSRTGEFNIIDGRCTKEPDTSVVNDFPLSRVERSIKALDRQTRIVEEREQARAKELARIPLRYNNGKARDLRDWNIINGAEWNESLAEQVRNKPSVWQWCSTERLDITET
jgi:hypothetical protein